MRVLVIARGALGFLTDSVKLCQYVATKHSVTYLGLQWQSSRTSDNDWMNIPGVTIEKVQAPVGKVERHYRWLRACIDECRKEYDVIYIFYFAGCSLVALAHPSKPIILDIRSISVSPRRAIRYRENFLLRLEASQYRWVSVISPELGTELRIPKNKSHVTPVGGDRLDLPRLSTDGVHLLYVGTLTGRRIEDAIAGFGRF